MKHLVLVLLSIVTLSCAVHDNNNFEINVPTPKVGVFEQESYDEALSNFEQMNSCEKKFVRYFEKKIYETYTNYKWKSCSKILNDDQKAYMSTWWAVQGILNTKPEMREAQCFVIVLIISMGTPREEAYDFVYAVTYQNYFSKYNFDVCAYNKDVHGF
jgi:hypothetical protein